MQTVFILGDSSLLTVTVLTWQYVRHVDKKSVYWETLRDTLNSMDKLKLAPKGNKLSTKINGLGLESLRRCCTDFWKPWSDCIYTVSLGLFMPKFYNRNYLI